MRKYLLARNEIIREDTLHCIKNSITSDQNAELDRIPSEDELRQTIMKMNPHSAPGPDGFGGKFYQVCFALLKRI